MEPLSRTESRESTSSRHSSHGLSQASPLAATRREVYGNIDFAKTNSGDVESMPPSGTSSKLNSRYPLRRPSSSYSHRTSSSTASAQLPVPLPFSSPLPSSLPPSASMASNSPSSSAVIDDSASASASASHESTPTLDGKRNPNLSPTAPLPDAFQVHRPEQDLDANRMSFSSLYQLGSDLYTRARGAMSSTPSSVAGSEPEGNAATQGTTTASAHLSVTTASHNGTLSPSPAVHPNSQSASMPATDSEPPSIASSPRNSIVGQPRHAPTMPPPRQPPASSSQRGRSSHTRRVSASTVASASPSTDRGVEEKPVSVGKIGICALDSKARSKPSRNILNRLISNGEFEVIVFGDKVILDEDVENWPICDFLISFFSEGFPLDKAIAYAKLRRPFCVNDLPMQTILWDRRICLQILQQLNVPTPPRVEVNRDGGPKVKSADIAQRVFEKTGLRLKLMDEVEEETSKHVPVVEMLDDDDTICVDGKKLTKPFVEKPTDGEDHNIHIYYPRSQGGGGRRLFRKINNKSSEKDETLTVPRSITEPDSSYIYEQFLKVENAEDVKAYTVGPTYCHAETRKSPVVDGVVKRNPNGKEVRYVTALTPKEQEMAAKVAEGFGQRVCGFDLLRVGDKSFVIDVNGWSFVKDNNAYYDKCASIMRDMFIREKLKWDSSRSSAVASESEDAGDKQQQNRKTTMSSMGSHRSHLRSALRSPSISKIRDGISHRKHIAGSPDPSAGTSPLNSPPSYDYNTQHTSQRPRTPTLHPSQSAADVLPPPAVGEDVGLGVHDPDADLSSDPVPQPASKSQWKLKGMVAVIRHADRTPKQKFKFTFHTAPFVNLLKGHREEVLLVGEAALDSVQVAVKQALAEGEEDRTKLLTLQNALSKKGAWPGTKVQIKPMFRKPKQEELPRQLTEEAIAEVANAEATGAKSGEAGIEVPPATHKRAESADETTLSRISAAENNLVLDKLQLVMKWGGEPTHSARYQAQDLGENIRNDLLLMNRDALKDVRFFTSSERRVTTSAQIFASAFLDNKELDPGVLCVRKDLLDDSNAAKDEMDKVKKKLKGLLRQGKQAPEQFAWPKDGTPEPYLVARSVVELMKFHRRVMRHNFTRLASDSEAESSLEKLKRPGNNNSNTSLETSKSEGQGKIDQKSIQSRWCAGEDAMLFKERWEKLFNEFTDAEKVDPSKISELYDTMKFDALHNRQFLEWVFTPPPDMAEEEAAVGVPLERTASQDLREEFRETHDGLAPSKDQSPPGKTSSQPANEKGEVKEKGSISRRMSVRRKSDNATTALRKAQASLAARASDHQESYFSLFTGNQNVPESKAKNDVRLEKLRELYRFSKVLFDYIGPQEYGMLDSEKLEIGLLTSLPLLKEIVQDLEEVQASEGAKSFIYFTKESHIYTLMNCILEGGVKTKIARNAIPELDYLSQICFELYESQNESSQQDDGESGSFNYSIRITISPGCHAFDPLDVQLDSKHCIGCAPRRSLTPHGDWKEVLQTLRAKFHTVKLPKSFLAVNLSEKVPHAFATVKDGEDVRVEASPIAIAH